MASGEAQVEVNMAAALEATSSSLRLNTELLGHAWDAARSDTPP